MLYVRIFPTVNLYNSSYRLAVDEFRALHGQITTLAISEAVDASCLRRAAAQTAVCRDLDVSSFTAHHHVRADQRCSLL
jgi:hypothetical protein